MSCAAARGTCRGTPIAVHGADHDEIASTVAAGARPFASGASRRMSGVREGKVDLVQAALAKGGVKPETLTSALVAASNNQEIAEMLDCPLSTVKTRLYQGLTVLRRRLERQQAETARVRRATWESTTQGAVRE